MTVVVLVRVFFLLCTKSVDKSQQDKQQTDRPKLKGMADQKGTLLAECHQTFSSKSGPQVYHMTDFGKFSPQQGLVF
jgi:hypothetical protein